MRILITGGNGQLGRTLAPLLTKRGHEVTILDIHNTVSHHKVVIADIRNVLALRQVMTGHDVVVHAAALHGVHFGTVPERAFIEVGILGTYNVLQAAQAANVAKVVYISSTSVYGISSSQSRCRVVHVNERTPLRPVDINDSCKVMGEQLCRYFSQSHKLDCTILRVGRFFENDWVDFNLRKLSGGVDVRDVAQSVLLAAEARKFSAQVFCIASRTRFTDADFPYLMGQADEVIEQRYPGARAACAQFGRSLPKTVHRVVSIKRAEKQLRYDPQWNFEVFLGLPQPPQEVEHIAELQPSLSRRDGKDNR